MTRRTQGGMVLEDGACAGRYSTTRAPHFLRAVIDADGHVDLLDQLVDVPTPRETVHVYQAVPGTIVDPDGYRRMGIIVCPPPGASGRYRHRADVDGELLRDTAAWRAWALSQPAPYPLLDVTTGQLQPAAVGDSK